MGMEAEARPDGVEDGSLCGVPMPAVLSKHAQKKLAKAQKKAASAAERRQQREAWPGLAGLSGAGGGKSSAGNGMSAPRWSRPSGSVGVSLTSVLKQGGLQRLRTLTQHERTLREASLVLESTPSCVAMRSASCTLALDGLTRMGLGAPAIDAPMTRCLKHIDWGAASGLFGRTLTAEWAARSSGVRLVSRSFDILPVGEGVEFADQANPPDDLWGLGEGSIDLMTATANLTSARDLHGFFWICARLLRRGSGELVLVQPLNFMASTMALRGVGSIESLFTPTLLRFHDLSVRDKGCGPTRVIELVLRRTMADRVWPLRTSESVHRFLHPERQPSHVEPPADIEHVVQKAITTARSLSLCLQLKLLGTGSLFSELAAEIAEPLRAVHASRSAAELRHQLLRSAGSAALPLEECLARGDATGGTGGSESVLQKDGDAPSRAQYVFALFFSVPSRDDAQRLAARLARSGGAERSGSDCACDRRQLQLRTYLLSSLSNLGDEASSGEQGTWLAVCAHFDCGAYEKLTHGDDGLCGSAPLATLAAACRGTIDELPPIPFLVEVIELSKVVDRFLEDGHGAPATVDRGLCARHKAQALLLLLQASARSYLERGGLALHERLDARQGRIGRLYL